MIKSDKRLRNKIYMYITSLTKNPKGTCISQSLPRYRIFFKLKEEKENSKAETSGENRGESTTNLFLLTMVSAEGPAKERGSEDGEKRRKRGGGLRRKLSAGR
jgi:hypothetical protein